VNRWKQNGAVSGVFETLSDPSAFKPTFEASAVGAEGASLTFQVKVTSIGGLQSNDSCVVKINTADLPAEEETRAWF